MLVIHSPECIYQLSGITMTTSSNSLRFGDGVRTGRFTANAFGNGTGDLISNGSGDDERDDATLFLSES